MSEVVFAFDKPVTGSPVGSKLPFPKLGHAYKGELLSVVENEHGFLEFYIKGEDVATNDKTKISFHKTNRMAPDFVYRMLNNLSASNESMKAAVGQTSASPLKWSNKGYKIGFSFQPETRNTGTKEAPVYTETGYLEPSPFTWSIDQVEGWVADDKVNDAFRAKHGKGGSTTAPTNTPAPATGLPVEDELPF